MKLALFAPYGINGHATGLMHLLANFLRPLCQEALEVRCNGIAKICDRDLSTGGARTLSSCMSCMHEQAALAEWSALSMHDLSQHLSPLEITDTVRWILGLKGSELRVAEFRGIRLFQLCAESVARREIALQNDTNLLSSHLISALQLALATQRFSRTERPDLALVSGGNDFITSTFLSQAREAGIRCATFVWDEASRSVNINHPHKAESFPCDLVVDDVLSLRSDLKTWPKEIVKVLEQISMFLGVSPDQLALPIAQ